MNQVIVGSYPAQRLEEVGVRDSVCYFFNIFHHRLIHART